MKQDHTKSTALKAPVIEFSADIKAAYIRFSRAKVARTESKVSKGMICAVDFDEKDRLIGIEFVGADEISIEAIRKRAPVKLPDFDPAKARFRMPETTRLAEVV